MLQQLAIGLIILAIPYFGRIGLKYAEQHFRNIFVWIAGIIFTVAITAILSILSIQMIPRVLILATDYNLGDWLTAIDDLSGKVMI